MHRRRRVILLARGLACALVCLAGVVRAGDPAPAAPPGVNRTALEALQRLKGMDLENNPTLKAAVLRVVESTRGTPDFVDLVRDFGLAGQETGLLEVAGKFPETEAGAAAVRQVLAGGGSALIRTRLREGTEEMQSGLVRALAHAADPRGVPLLTEVASQADLPVATRSAAVRGLARTEDGARQVLALARDGRLDEPLRNTASLALAQARWPDVRDAAAGLLPLPRAADGRALPAPVELARLTGDAARGARVFRSEQAGCSKCHQVGGDGIDFGPALTQIGGKLGREALYESILDPSAGISFGYEGWNVVMSDGEEVFGIVASETAEELAVKQQTGSVVRLKKSGIAERERQKLSIMPAGLGQLLTREELVDLVEYLTTLRAP